MKINKYIIGLGLTFSFLFAGCDSFLDRSVRSFAANLKTAVMISPISIKSTHASVQIPI